MRRKAHAPSAAPRRAFVDSSGWIALISADDRHHPAADAVFREAVARRVHLLTTNLVAAEVHRLLLFRVGIRAAATALARIAKSEGTELGFATRELHVAAMQWLARLDDQVITYTDAVSFAMMRARGCERVISFDNDFVVAGFVPWTHV